MKSSFNVILGIVIAVILYFCYTAILVPVSFNKAKNIRDIAVVHRLELIRNTQKEYSKIHNGRYCGSWTELIAFAKNAKLPRTLYNKTSKETDTVWVNLSDSLYPTKFNIDSIKYVPFGRGVTFEIQTKEGMMNNIKIHLLQVQTPYNVYLLGLNNDEIDELENLQAGMKKYAGLRIGSLEAPNGLEGNWEANNKQ